MVGNTKLSGATSYKQTSFGIIPRSKLLPLEIKGVKKGLEFVYKLVKITKNTEITSQLIRELHTVSFGWIFPNWAGKFRKIQVTYSSKEAPSYYQVPELVKNLCADLQIQLNNLPLPVEDDYIERVVSLLAWFQHRFVFIHPFQDYNGRTARMFTTLLLLYFGLPAVEIKVENKADRKEYLQAMQQGDEGNLSVLEDLITSALVEELSKTK